MASLSSSGKSSPKRYIDWEKSWSQRLWQLSESSGLNFVFSLIGVHGIHCSHYGYCNSSLCDKGSRLNNLVGPASLKTVICHIYYSSTGLCEKLLHICIVFIISFIVIVCVFAFQNINIKDRNFYVFTIFRNSQLVFVPLKILLFIESSVQNFLIPTANLLIIPGPPW